MYRSLLRKSVLVAALATAVAAGHSSADARPGPDDDPNYNHPMWIYANPGETYRMVQYDPRPDPWVVGTINVGQQAVVNP